MRETEWPLSSKHIFGQCIILSCILNKKVLKFILTLTFLILETVWLGCGVYRKLHTLIGGQHAEKFENHCSRQITVKMVIGF